MIKVAVLGYGTVGSGVVEVLDKNKDLIAKRVGDEIEVKYILDLRDFPGDPFEDKVIHDFNIIANDPEVSIVCETMGGTRPAYQFTKECLEKGKSVCTSNKELVAAFGPELLQTAKANNCSYFFEASVGGGIPIIRPMNTSLAPESIEKIKGILNGTTNYILTKMAKEGADYAEVLKEAQDKGYAERNPEADVEGYDACRKIAILSSLMTGKNVDFNKIYTEGITKITTRDFVYAKAVNKSIKLLAVSERTPEGAAIMVAPFMIGADHPLNGVNDVFNAVYVTGNMVGDLMFYGHGAGKLATASAVVADVIESAKTLGNNVPVLWDAENLALTDIGNLERKFFVRVSMEDRGAVMNSFSKVTEISTDDVDFGFITDSMTENEFKTRIAGIKEVLSVIRVEDEN